jgi:hypothetical protein
MWRDIHLTSGLTKHDVQKFLLEEIGNLEKFKEESVLAISDPEQKREFEKVAEEYIGKVRTLLAENAARKSCYIATAVYGSYDAPEVRILRRFRDEVLLKSNAGRKFVAFYYRHSPHYAEKLKSHRYINRIVRCVLDGIVVLIEKAHRSCDCGD